MMITGTDTAIERKKAIKKAFVGTSAMRSFRSATSFTMALGSPRIITAFKIAAIARMIR